MEFFFIFLTLCLMLIIAIVVFVVVPGALLLNEILTTPQFKYRLYSNDPYIKAHYVESILKIVIGGVGVMAIGVIFALYTSVASASAETYHDPTEISVIEQVKEPIVEEDTTETQDVSEPKEIVEDQKSVEEEKPQSYSKYSGSYFKKMGVINENGWRYTWYSSNVARHYRTSEWVVDDNGVYRDADGFVVVAVVSDPQGNAISFGDVVPTPFGPGKKYDCGCDGGTIDVYVNF